MKTLLLSSAKSTWRSAFDRVGPTTFGGYVYDKAHPTRTHVVEILVDGVGVDAARAGRLVPSLLRHCVGDGRRGFSFSLAPELVAQGRVVEARLANTDTPVGRPIDLTAAPAPTPSWLEAGMVEWLGGLRLRGWVRGTADGQRIRIRVDGDLVDEIGATGFAHIGDDGHDIRVGRSFDWHLPDRFADGRTHHVEALTETGLPLDGCPLVVLAFADGLAPLIAGHADVEAHRPRAERFDAMFPLSLPLSRHAEWKSLFPPTRPAPRHDPVAVILTGPGETEKTIASLEAQEGCTWVGAAVPDGEIVAGFDVEALGEVLGAEAGEAGIIVFAPAGVTFAPDALARFASALDGSPADMAYADLDMVAPDGAITPTAFGVFDYERCLEQGHAAILFAIRRAALEAALVDGPSDQYALFFKCLRRCHGPGSILHLPGAVAQVPAMDRTAVARQLALAVRRHLAGTDPGAVIEPGRGAMLPALTVRRAPPAGATTVIIPVRNDGDRLDACLRSLGPGIRQAGASLLLVDNGSRDETTLRILRDARRQGVGILEAPGDFNPAALRNAGAAVATGERLCFLSVASEAVSEDWLVELESRAAGPSVGAVGPIETYATGLVRQAGLVLGPDFGAAPAFADNLSTGAGYLDLLRVAHQVSALSASALLVTKSAFQSVGGFDEVAFPVFDHAIDLCLKLRARHLRIILTPHAVLRREDADPDRRAGHWLLLAARERDDLRRRWAEVLADDPFYSPTLALDARPYGALRWRWSDRPRAGGPPRFPTTEALHAEERLNTPFPPDRTVVAQPSVKETAPL